MGEIENLGLEPDLAYLERGYLGAHLLAAAQEVDQHFILAGRHVGGELHLGAKQPRSQESDLPDRGRVEALPLLVATQRGAELGDLLFRRARLGDEAQMFESDLQARPHGRRDDIVQWSAGGHGIEGRHTGKAHLPAVNINPGDLVLAAHHGALRGPAHHDHHVAFAVGRAEQDNFRADEAGGDLHPVLREIGDQRLGARGGGRENA